MVFEHTLDNKQKHLRTLKRKNYHKIISFDVQVYINKLVIGPDQTFP